MANRRFTQFFYTLHRMPVMIDCTFTVAAADTAGNGITGLKGRGVQAVYMHTSATASATNPNPANGIIIVQLVDNYTKFMAAHGTAQAPYSGSDVTTTVANTSYAITTVGTTTLAQWQAVGLPKGIKPAVGASFTATASQAIGGTGAVQVIASAGAGFDHIEVFGDPNTSINPSSAYATTTPTAYPQLMFQCFKEHVVSAPADKTVINISMLLGNSSVQFAGE